MSKKAPNPYVAPVVIAGITVGFFASAYQFVFKKSHIRATSKKPEVSTAHHTSENLPQ